MATWFVLYLTFAPGIAPTLPVAFSTIQQCGQAGARALQDNPSSVVGIECRKQMMPALSAFESKRK